MRVLLICGLEGMRRFVVPLAHQLSIRGLKVEILDVEEWVILDSNYEKISKGPKPKLLIKGFRAFTKQYQFQKWLNSIAQNAYDSVLLIALHQWMVGSGPYLRRISHNVVLFYGGSDLFRVTKRKLLKQEALHEYCNAVTYTQDEMKMFIINNFPKITEVSNLHRVRFGIEKLEAIERQAFRRKELREKYGFSPQDIIVVIGYNASYFQQHLKIVESCPALRNDCVKVVFPMTYPNVSDYREELRMACIKTGLDFKILSEYLSEQEVVDLRLIEDIVINMQTTDASSSSLLESAFAGSTLLLGEWLPYSFWKDYKAVYQRVTFENLNEHLEVAISKVGSKKGLNENIKKDYSWEERIHDWLTVIGYEGR